jgi:hypothetical protein
VRKQDGYAGMPGRPHCAAFGAHRACCAAFKTQSGVAIENVGPADLNVAAGVPAWEMVVWARAAAFAAKNAMWPGDRVDRVDFQK